MTFTDQELYLAGIFFVLGFITGLLCTLEIVVRRR